MLKKILKWTVIVIAGGYIILVIGRMFYFSSVDKTNAQVAKIHATKLTLDDVMGKNLPPPPGAEADKTVQGIDANANGIRDDVELAIFKEYQNSAKTRAVLLQYALALQMEVTQPIVNEEIVITVAQEGGRAHLCVGEVLSKNDREKYVEQANSLRSFVEDKQLNTEQRKKAQEDFYRKLGSYNSLERGCDIELSTLSN